MIIYFLIPGLSLRSNPGLKLANAFGVISTDALLLFTAARSSSIQFNRHSTERGAVPAPTFVLTSLQPRALRCKPGELLPLLPFPDLQKLIFSPRRVFQLFL